MVLPAAAALCSLGKLLHISCVIEKSLRAKVEVFSSDAVTEQAVERCKQVASQSIFYPF